MFTFNKRKPKETTEMEGRRKGGREEGGSYLFRMCDSNYIKWIRKSTHPTGIFLIMNHYGKKNVQKKSISTSH